MQTKLLMCNYQLLSVFFCFCSNWKKKGFSQGESFIPQSVSTHRHNYKLLPTTFTPPLTPLHLFPSSLVSSLFPSSGCFRISQHHPLCHHHLQRAVPPLNGIIIGPALLLIAKVTIAHTCARLKACASHAASDTSVVRGMSVDRCARWSRTGGERGDLDINEMVTKLTLAN